MARGLTIVLLMAVITATGCFGGSVEVGSDPGPHAKRGHGPPPHAPAHGYRHKHKGSEIVFDAKLGVYVVIGLPYHYYDHGHYLRLRGGAWEMSVNLDGPWSAYSATSVPASLRNAKLDGGKPGKSGKSGKLPAHAPANQR